MKIVNGNNTMSEYPKISVITPSFNQGQYLEETILSVLNQNYPDLEYIIIDGGSTDNSVEIIKKYEDRLAYWVSEPDKGMYHAIQKGFDRSTGEIMAWINSDDVYFGRSFKTIAQIFSDYLDVKWITGQVSMIDEEGNSIGADRMRLWSAIGFAQGDCKYIMQEATFWRRSIWVNAGGYISQEYSLAGDFELWSRFFIYDRLYSVNSILSHFRVRTVNQKSHDKSLYGRQINEILKAMSVKLNRKLIHIIYDYLRHIPILNKLTNKMHCKLFDYPHPLIYSYSERRFIKYQGDLIHTHWVHRI